MSRFCFQNFVVKAEDYKEVSPLDLLEASFSRHCPCFKSKYFTGKKHCANVRYLLVMTEKYSALPIIEEMYLKNRDDVNVIFGSSFPKDQEFAQVMVLPSSHHLNRTDHIYLPLVKSRPKIFIVYSSLTSPSQYLCLHVMKKIQLS